MTMSAVITTHQKIESFSLLWQPDPQNNDTIIQQIEQFIATELSARTQVLNWFITAQTNDGSNDRYHIEGNCVR